MKYKIGDHLELKGTNDYILKIVEIDKGTMRTMYIFDVVGHDFTLDFAVDFVDRNFDKISLYDSPLYKAMNEEEDDE